MHPHECREYVIKRLKWKESYIIPYLQSSLCLYGQSHITELFANGVDYLFTGFGIFRYSTHVSLNGDTLVIGCDCPLLYGIDSNNVEQSYVFMSDVSWRKCAELVWVYDYLSLTPCRITTLYHLYK